MSHRGVRAALLFVALVGAPIVSAAQPVTVSPSEVRFAAAGHGTTLITTPPQLVFLERQGTTHPAWSAAASEPWIALSTPSGLAPSRLTVAIHAPSLPASPGEYRGSVTITFPEQNHPPLVVTVVINRIGGESAPPRGVIGAGAGVISLKTTPIRLQGWALDDVGVARVTLCYESLRVQTPSTSCVGEATRPIGEAAFLHGARPDVARAFRTWPQRERGAWTIVLTPETFGDLHGTVRLLAVAEDAEGQTTLLGTRFVTVDTEVAPAPFPATLRALAPLGGVIVFFLVVHAWTGWVVRSRTAPAQVRVSPQPPRYEWLVVAGFVAVFVWLQVPWMTTSLGYDELLTASLFVVDVPMAVAATTVYVFNNHIGYSLLAHLAVQGLGSAEWVVRLPALFFACGAIVMTWRLTRELWPGAAGLLAAALVAASPFFGEWAHSARGYSGVTCLTLVSTYAFLTLLERPSRRWAAVHALANVCVVYLHLYGVWVVAVQYAWFLWRAYARREPLAALWASFLVSAVAVVALYSPVVMGLLDMIGVRGRTEVQMAFPAQLFHALTGTSSPALAAAVAALGLFGLVLLRRRHAPYLLALLLVPFTAMWLGLRPIDLYVRFFAYWMPVLAILLAIGVVATVTKAIAAGRSLPSRAIGWALAVVAILVPGLLIAGWLTRASAPPTSGYREALRPLVRGPETRVAAMGSDSKMFEYYAGKPLRVIHFRNELEGLLREPGPVGVIYFAMPWNPPELAVMAATLQRRCPAVTSGSVTVFTCD